MLRWKKTEEEKKHSGWGIGAARFQSSHLYRRFDQLVPRGRTIDQKVGGINDIAPLEATPSILRRRGIHLVLRREVISSLTRVRKEAIGESKGKLRVYNILPASISGRSFEAGTRHPRQAGLSSSLLFRELDSAGLVRQEALWKMLRPYRH